MPVVIADLHSALPAIVAGVRADRPGARVAYVMTDGGALPAWFSRTLDGLRGALAGTVTVGQAFGGDLEATNVHSGLLAARHVLDADVAVVTQGPGNLGTGTTWGFSGVAAGEAVNAAAVLGGRPVGSLRISDADPRPRHRGVSHHSLTAYGRVALAPADLVVPAGPDPALAAEVAAALAPLAPPHRIVTVDTDGLDAALRACRSRCPRWAATWTPTTPTSSRRGRRPARGPAGRRQRRRCAGRRPRSRSGGRSADRSTKAGQPPTIASEHERPAPRSGPCTRRAGCARSRPRSCSRRRS